MKTEGERNNARDRGEVEISPYPAAGIELRQIQRFTSLDGYRILEVGCGDGRLTLQLARLASFVVAIDPDRVAIGDAGKNAGARGIRNVEFRVGSGEEMRSNGPPFDAAVFSWSL